MNASQVNGELLTKSIALIKSAQYPSGLFPASPKGVSTGYNLAWIRDNVYAALGLASTNEKKAAINAIRALLAILKKHEYKIDWIIKQPEPKHSYRYIHARYDPLTGNEIWEPWGNKQNDAIGALLFNIGRLERTGIKVIRNEADIRVLQKLVNYLEAIQYWHDADNGMWEENEELHASSVGACVAGLRAVQGIVDVPPRLIEKGMHTLNALLPNESPTKKADLSLLSLIYPYEVVNKEMAELILANIEGSLVRERGVIRYVGDTYYMGEREASWTIGLPWLAIAWKALNRPDKYAYYMRKTINIMNEEGELPELYIDDGPKHNENSPLIWAQAMFLIASTL